jgi:hypothetical protein
MEGFLWILMSAFCVSDAPHKWYAAVKDDANKLRFFYGFWLLLCVVCVAKAVQIVIEIRAWY